MVVDSSVILAIFFAEPHASWAAQQLNDHPGSLCMSTVNLAEVLIRAKDRQPHQFERLELGLLGSGIRFVAPNVEQARIAADARLRYPLNLGDCFAYALAKSENSSILTLDQDFKSVDLPVLFPEAV
jgi:ribonuclease VapC